MGTGKSLQDIMNDVSARLDGALLLPPPVPVLTELQAFLTFDPLLASLHKEYLDAKDNRAKAVKDFGADDAMTEMAMLVEDSAWCAMQTRYMELRADRALMAKAQDLMEEERLAATRQREKENAKDALRYYNYLDMIVRMRRKRESDMNWAALALLLVLNGNLDGFRFYQPMHQFNRLAA